MAQLLAIQVSDLVTPMPPLRANPVGGSMSPHVANDVPRIEDQEGESLVISNPLGESRPFTTIQQAIPFLRQRAPHPRGGRGPSQQPPFQRLLPSRHRFHIGETILPVVDEVGGGQPAAYFQLAAYFQPAASLAGGGWPPPELLRKTHVMLWFPAIT